VVRPGYQQLCGDDGADAGLSEQGGPCRVLLNQGHELGIELGELGRKEPDPGGDGLQAETPTGDARPVPPPGPAADRSGSAGRSTNDHATAPGDVRERPRSRLLSSLIALVRLTRTPSLQANTIRSASRRPPARGAPCSSRDSACRAARIASIRSFFAPRARLRAPTSTTVSPASARNTTRPAAKLPVPSNAHIRRPGACSAAQVSIRRYPAPSAVSAKWARTRPALVSSTARSMVSRSGSPLMTKSYSSASTTIAVVLPSEGERGRHRPG